MQDKIKYIVFGAAAFVILIALMFLGLKVKQLDREKQNLIGENTSLSQKITAISQENSDLQQKVSDLGKNIEDINFQKNEIQQKYDMLAKERDALVEQIGKMKAEEEKKAKEGPQGKPVPASMDDAYLAGLLKQKADLEVQVEMMRTTLKNLKTANDQLLLEKNSLSFEINNLSRDTQDLTHASEYNQKMVDNLTDALAREKTDKLEMAKRLKAIKSDNRLLRQQIQSLGERRLQLEKKVADLQGKNATLENSLTSMELYVKQQLFQMDELKNQIEEVKTPASRAIPKSAAVSRSEYPVSSSDSRRKDAIQLPPIVVKPQTQAKNDVPDLGDTVKIVSIDKENNFVVVNAGRDSGLKIGDSFQVYRNGKGIGMVEVIQTRERIAACDIKSESTPLRVGDSIQ